MTDPRAHGQTDQFAHSQDDQRNCGCRADPHALREIGEFFGRLIRREHWLKRHTTNRARAGLVPEDFGMHRARPLSTYLAMRLRLLRMSRGVVIWVAAKLRFTVL